MSHEPNGWFCWWCPKSVLKFHQSLQSMSIISSPAPLQSQRVWLHGCTISWSVSYIAVCVCVCVFRVCGHMIVSLLKYLDSLCSCGTIYHVSWQGEENRNPATSLQDAKVSWLSEYPGFMGCKTSRGGPCSTTVIQDLGWKVGGIAMSVYNVVLEEKLVNCDYIRSDVKM